MIWRSGSAAIIYRGKDYVHPSKLSQSILQTRRQPPQSLMTRLVSTLDPPVESFSSELQVEDFELGQQQDQTRFETENVPSLGSTQNDVVDFNDDASQGGLSNDEVTEGNVDSTLSAVKDDLLSEFVATRSVVPPREALSDIMGRELQEVETILEGLGPRYQGWTGQRPVPVDGDLLLADESAYKKPYRLLPYGVRPSLSNNELTDLRRLARPLPPHFVLG